MSARQFQDAIAIAAEVAANPAWIDDISPQHARALSFTVGFAHLLKKLDPSLAAEVEALVQFEDVENAPSGQ